MAEEELSNRLRLLERRVAALEQKVGKVRGGSGTSPSQPALGYLQSLQQRSGRRFGTRAKRGAFGYAGALRDGEREVLWVKEHSLPELLQVPLDAAAQVLASVGSPVRLAILRFLADKGSAERKDLQALSGKLSVGQLYHHLNDLLAAGLIVQPQRGVYALRPAAVVPVLSMLGAAHDVALAGKPGEHADGA